MFCYPLMSNLLNYVSPTKGMKGTLEILDHHKV